MSLRHVFESLKTHSEIQEAESKVVKLVKEGKITLQNSSLLDIAEATLGRTGLDKLRAMNSESTFIGLRESVDPVNLSAFTNITGNLLFQIGKLAYEAPEFIGGQLVQEEKAVDDGGREIGLAPIDDDAMIVKEGEEFKDVKFGEDYIDIPTSVKRGLKIGITREMIFFDRTNDAIRMAQTIGERLGVNKEKRILNMVLGITNGFTRKGVARNTYVATGGGDPRVNKLASVALEDWTDMDAAMQLFNAMSDDRTSPEPIMVNPDTLIVTKAQEWTARRILNATEIRQTTNTNNTTIGGNPVPGMNVISSPWISRLLIASGLTSTQANAHWHLGQPKRAFKYRTLFPFQIRAAQHDKDEFERDVVAQFRADERGVPRIVAPWYMAQIYNT